MVPRWAAVSASRKRPSQYPLVDAAAAAAGGAAVPTLLLTKGRALEPLAGRGGKFCMAGSGLVDRICESQ